MPFAGKAYTGAEFSVSVRGLGTKGRVGGGRVSGGGGGGGLPGIHIKRPVRIASDEIEAITKIATTVTALQVLRGSILLSIALRKSHDV